MQHHELSETAKKALAAASVAIFVLFSLAAAYFLGGPIVRYAAEPARFRAWIDSFGAWGQLAFIGMVALQVVVALIPGEALEIGAGYAFGAVQGTLLCQAGIALGTALVFLFVRRFGVRVLEIFFSLDKINSMRFLRDTKRLYLLTAIVFFIPGTPKDLITYFLGVTKMRLGPLLLLSTFARLPSVVTSTISGDALGTANYTAAAIAFGVTLAISGIGLLIYRRIARSRDESQE